MTSISVIPAEREARGPESMNTSRRRLRGRWSWIPDSRCRGFRNDPLLIVRSLHALLIKGCGHAAAVELERALAADRVGALEDPVLPGAEAAENLGLHRLRPGEAQICFHAGQRVRRETRALLEHDPQLVVPVIGFDDCRDEAELVCLLGLQRRADLGFQPLHLLR